MKKNEKCVEFFFFFEGEKCVELGSPLKKH